MWQDNEALNDVNFDMINHEYIVKHSNFLLTIWQDNEVLNDVNVDMINNDLTVKHSNFFLTTL